MSDESYIYTVRSNHVSLLNNTWPNEGQKTVQSRELRDPSHRKWNITRSNPYSKFESNRIINKRERTICKLEKYWKMREWSTPGREVWRYPEYTNSVKEFVENRVVFDIKFLMKGFLCVDVFWKPTLCRPNDVPCVRVFTDLVKTYPTKVLSGLLHKRSSSFNCSRETSSQGVVRHCNTTNPSSPLPVFSDLQGLEMKDQRISKGISVEHQTNEGNGGKNSHS